MPVEGSLLESHIPSVYGIKPIQLLARNPARDAARPSLIIPRWVPICQKKLGYLVEYGRSLSHRVGGSGSVP